MKVRITTLVLIAAVAAVAAAPAEADGLSPHDLLAQYQPITVLSQGELFAPTAVSDFLADATAQLPRLRSYEALTAMRVGASARQRLAARPSVSGDRRAGPGRRLLRPRPPGRASSTAGTR